jgi:hypothetical protein
VNSRSREQRHLPCAVAKTPEIRLAGTSPVGVRCRGTILPSRAPPAICLPAIAKAGKRKERSQMPKRPPVDELEFLKICRNHGELSANLATLGIPSQDVLEYAKYVCECWFGLAEQHLAEAKKALAAGCARAVFSRAYYAAYNASKAARYIVRGTVSLKADDHGLASTALPSDLPNVAQWAQEITLLYEHRLRADYDNWSATTNSNSLTPADTISKAGTFIDEVRMYINGKVGPFL